jgi:aldehyde:ferredoxin oxidoreductase
MDAVFSKVYRKMNGYFSKILEIDLDTGSHKIADIPDALLRDTIGGSGLGAKLLFDRTGKETDPLGPDNRLIFAAGPFTGTKIPSTGRHAIVGKSPLTGIFAESDVGGRWGTRLRGAGLDILEIRGASARTVIIVIDEDRVEIEDGSHLWGLDAYETADALRETHGPKAEVAAIGPAGERQVLMASVMHDGRHGRAAGRCGLGAVMGAKQVKAIVVLGNRKAPVADPDGLKAHVREMLGRIKASSAYLRQYGTSGGLMCLEASGDMPIQNFARGSWPNAEKLTGERLAETYLKGRYACGACPIGCGREVAFRTDRYTVEKGAGPEYESLASLGAYCLVDDLAAVCKANDLCNRYGMDTISVGAAVAFAMEAFDRGLITETDLGGMALRWGDADAMLETVRLIGEKEGFGRILGQGVKKAAEHIGPEAAAFAVHVKGLELPAHDPRAYFSSAVSYATSNRGGCHLAGLTHALEGSLAIPELGYPQPLDRFTTSGKGVMAAKMQNLMGLLDSLKICKFVLYAGVTVSDLLTCLRLTTGWEGDLPDFLRTGERIFNLKRLYNLRCGVRSSDDALPPRMTTPLREGGAKGRTPDLERMLAEYYDFRGWDETGAPTPEKLAELGLDRPADA